MTSRSASPIWRRGSGGRTATGVPVRFLTHMPYKDAETRRLHSREYGRRYRQSAAGKQAIANSDRARNANRRAASFGVYDRITTADVRKVMAADKCFYCNGRDKLGLDHVVPLARGGPNELTNLVCCCLSCNISKRNGDRPGRWSWDHEVCAICGTTDRRHAARGYCTLCYRRAFGPSREVHAAYERARRERKRLREADH